MEPVRGFLMKNITSRNNEIFKNALKLTRKKYRDAEGRYLLEGVKPLRDAFARDWMWNGYFYERHQPRESVLSERIFALLCWRTGCLMKYPIRKHPRE